MEASGVRGTPRSGVSRCAAMEQQQYRRRGRQRSRRARAYPPELKRQRRGAGGTSVEVEVVVVECNGGVVVAGNCIGIVAAGDQGDHRGQCDCDGSLPTQGETQQGRKMWTENRLDRLCIKLSKKPVLWSAQVVG